MDKRHVEANYDFYDKEYFLAGSGGAELYRETSGGALDVYKERAIALAAPMPHERVLDIGCGRGEIILACLQRGSEAWALDFSRAALDLTLNTIRANDAEAESRLSLVQSDAVEMDFEENFFDCVITTDFVEHVLPDRLQTVVKKVYRSLKPGGRFIIHTAPSIGYMYFGQYVARLMEVAQRKTVSPIETFEYQLEVGGHCNIQSVRSLRALLHEFSQHQAWAEFSLNEGAVKAVLNKLRITPLLAHHIYAAAYK